MLLSVRTWAPCYGGHGDASCLYIAGLSAVGGQGNVSLCTNLDSLLGKDREMVLLCVYLDSLLVNNRNCFSLHVLGLSADGG